MNQTLKKILIKESLALEDANHSDATGLLALLDQLPEPWRDEILCSNARDELRFHRVLGELADALDRGDDSAASDLLATLMQSPDRLRQLPNSIRECLDGIMGQPVASAAQDASPTPAATGEEQTGQNLKTRLDELLDAKDWNGAFELLREENEGRTASPGDWLTIAHRAEEAERMDVEGAALDSWIDMLDCGEAEDLAGRVRAMLSALEQQHGGENLPVALNWLGRYGDLLLKEHGKDPRALEYVRRIYQAIAEQEPQSLTDMGRAFLQASPKRLLPVAYYSWKNKSLDELWLGAFWQPCHSVLNYQEFTLPGRRQYEPGGLADAFNRLHDRQNFRAELADWCTVDELGGRTDRCCLVFSEGITANNCKIVCYPETNGQSWYRMVLFSLRVDEQQFDTLKSVYDPMELAAFSGLKQVADQILGLVGEAANALQANEDHDQAEGGFISSFDDDADPE